MTGQIPDGICLKKYDVKPCVIAHFKEIRKNFHMNFPFLIQKG